MYFCRREHYMSPKIKLDFYNWQNGFDGLSSPIIRAYTAALTKFRVSAKMIQLNSLLKAICQHFLLVSTGRFQLLLPLRSFTVLQAAQVTRKVVYPGFLCRKCISLILLHYMTTFVMSYAGHTSVAVTEVWLTSPLLMELGSHLLHCRPTKVHQ